MDAAARALGLAAALVVADACAQTAVSDGFESGAFAAEWDTVSGAAVRSGGGAEGSSRFAALGAANNLGARFTDAAPGGAADFYVQCDFRVTNSAGRQFNLHVSTALGAPGSGAPTVNLRLEGGAWSAYSGSWRAITNLASASTGQWYRVRLSGWDWGRPAARYGVALSDAGGTAFTSASATNLTWYQSNVPTNAPARYFDFTSDFGPCPGYQVDNVRAEIAAQAAPDAVINISGTYPHLAVFSGDGEIGMGAVMPWAGRLWFVTYPPHQPNGSPDKLWSVSSNLALSAYAGSVGCTDANRLAHRESGQLNIGHYLIDATGGVRVIPPSAMPGRLTGAARHLTDPANKLYVATMEEGLYELDVNSLAVTEVYHDMNTAVTGQQKAASLPGNHGKGLYSSQGKLFFSNNGSGGSLSAWDGASWTVVETNKYTELTGPGGVWGNAPGDDRLWSLGWDARSVILRLYQDGAWTRFRLPKGSYTHDSDTGWYTEWPRIREVKDGLSLMHMHGLFYRFPKGFSAGATGGLEPLCTFLKMPVDYCWWEGRLAMGRDDASTTGGNVWAGQSHSAPWFGQLDDLRRWGPPAGVGGPWLRDAVRAGVASEPFFVGGFTKRTLHLRHGAASAVDFSVEVDAAGDGAWTSCAQVRVPANGYAWCALPAALPAEWARLKPSADAPGATAYFTLANAVRAADDALLAGLAPAGTQGAYSDGILRPQSGDARTLQFAVSRYAAGGAPLGQAYYEIDGAFRLRAATNAAAEAALRGTYGLTNAGFAVDAASVIVTEGANRFRLPKGHASYDAAGASGWPRGAREVVTERQLFNAHGSFYELPYGGSGGFRRLRPVCTHNLQISDFCSWRGLLVLAGVSEGAATNGHVFAALDGRAALWFGDVDDLWRFGEPRGEGGPWRQTPVAAGEASDPYLMAGYDRKELRLSHGSAATVTFTVEVDVAADSVWSAYRAFAVPAGETVTHVFPDGYSAHWVRVRADVACQATALFSYRPRRVTSMVLK
jgi:hypothetical protein